MDATITNLLSEVARVLDEPGPATPERQAETQRLLERLCGVYLESDADGRAAIRAAIAARQDGNFWAMHELVSRLTREITGPDAVPTLRLALAAVSIENCGLDYRETGQMVINLYEQAAGAGIDAQPLFEAVAAISTDSPTAGGCDSVAQILRVSGPRDKVAGREE
ncbi:hypothetical protein [Paludisphaera sp.]|uniref:hypothetical protein n=1 Tax=Paludisphaera sp. TaxID=2017432 RepID=UPI00301C94C0